jgi:hypothetical protein
MKRKLLTAAIAAGALAFGGAAFAQSSTHSPSSGPGGATTPGAESPSGAGGAGMGSGSGMKSSPGAAAEKPATPPQSIVGKNVVNTKGDTIGEIKSVKGDQVIVSVGGFLGIGSRDVALNWNELTMTGSGDNAKLQTTMTKDELKNLPEYKADNSSSGSSPSTTTPSGSRMRSR